MKKRPLGISILSVLGIVGGVLILAMQFKMAHVYRSAGEASGVSGFSILSFQVFLGLWGLLSGMGMWLGKKWGWWLGSTYIAYSVVRNVTAAMMLPGILNTHSGMSLAPLVLYGRYIGRALFHSVVFCYYFRSNVLDFFNYPAKRRWILALYVLIAVAVVALAWQVFSI